MANITPDKEDINVSLDPGNLLVTSTNNFEATESNMIDHAKKNYIHLVKHLFSLLKDQLGKDEENRDYDKPIDEVKLPEPILKLPRYKPIPKEKPLTKWEKYRQEKGIQKKKRSRMVFSELTQSYVPRWGKGSIKQIEKEANWAMEDDASGVNPFDKQAMEKNLKKAKQEKREMKNIMNAKKEMKIKEKIIEGKGKKNKKMAKMAKEISNLEKDKKHLGKTLEMVQKSTRSMGHFDKKLKNEKELNMIKRKRVPQDILMSRKRERSRDKQILDSLLKQK
ncbi:MAG: ribosome biogenesis regulatory protein homolog [archaeon]|nr:ribosome biogenesis regulatory protein homolog [archaeon]